MMTLRSPLTLLVCLLAVGSAATASAQAVARADVDRDCVVTRTDASIVMAQLGKKTGQAGFNPNADVDQNGVVNNVDVTFVTRNVGKNVCAPPPPAPTIVASIAPVPNANGWNNTAVTVSFVCTNATSCPTPVTLATEGAAQVVSRTVANSANVTATASVTVNIDQTPPVLTATPPAVVAPGGAVTIPVTVVDLSGLASANLRVQRAIVATDTAAPYALDWVVPATIAAGTQDAFEVIGEDRAGNVAALRRPFSVESRDQVLPTVSIGAPASAGPGATVPLTVRAADDRGTPSRVRVTRTDAGGSTLVEDRTTAPFAFQAIGQIPAGAAAGTVVSFVALVTDASGNTAAASADVQVVTSVTTPTLVINVDPPLSPTFQNDGVITGTIGKGTSTVPPPATPLVAALSPTSGGQGQTVDITITGVNTSFGSLTQVALGTGVSVASINVTSPTTLVARAVIAANAPAGPRLVAVSTGNQQALLADAFSVVAGTGQVSGRVVTSATQPIANAQVCAPTGTPCATSSATGTFTASGIAVDQKRVVVSASGFETASVPVAVTPNGTSSVGDIVLAINNQPPPPPPPNSPPISPALAVVLGRGATESLPGGNPDQLKAVVRDAFLAAGGQEMGVLDANGQQLNPKMIGAGYVSITDAAVTDIAKEMVFGQTMTLAKLLTIFMGSLDLPGVKTPSLARTIQALQASVDAVWADPSRPEAPLVMLLFNQGRTASVAPPTLTIDTELNALQVNLATVAFMTTVTRFLPEGTAPPFTSVDPALVAPAPRPGLLDRARGLLASLVPSVGGRSMASLSGWLAPAPAIGRAWPRPGAPATPQRQTSGSSTTATRPGSVFWGGVLATTLDGVQSQGWNVAKKSGGLCDTFLVTVAQVSVPGGTPEGVVAAEDPNAKFLPTPSCSTAIELAELLVTGGDSSYQASASNLKNFLLGNQATAKAIAQVDDAFKSKGYQDAWAAAKAEARQAGLINGVIKQAGSFVESGLAKIQGAVVDSLLAFEAQLVIQSVRPRQPFIRKVEQMFDPSQTPAAPSHIVKIHFDRSPNDKGAKNDPAVDWRYRLYRGNRGDYRPVAMKRFKDGDEISFTDMVPADGTYSWVVIGVRQTGPAIDDPPPANWFLEWLGGFFDTTLKIGEGSAQRAVIGLDVVKTVTQPMAQIYKGIAYQTSDPSDPQMFYVSTAPPVPKPPVSLAVWRGLDLAFASVPTLDSIFVRANNGNNVNLYATPNFKAPGAVGLAISGDGTLYTDNAASDAQFGGRVFNFAPTNGARNLAGTVNYFSQLLMFANPVSVTSMTTATGPFGANLTNFYEESLFIADAQTQRITRMTLPSSLPAGYPLNRNVSQPWVTSPLFNFGPDTALSMSATNTLAVTQGNEVLLATPPGPWAAPSSVQALFGTAAPSPFTRLSGVTFDGQTNMYVSDSVQGTLSMIPAPILPGSGLAGLGTVARKKLVVERGLLRPSDVKLNGPGDGLIFYDGERLIAETRFGMSGQVVDQNGVPLAGAVVHVPARRETAVTDTDGVYVMPNLVKVGESAVVAFTVKYRGQTQSYTRTLDILKHNITDIVFGPPAPLPPDPVTPPTPPPPPPTPRKTDKTDPNDPVRRTVAMEVELDPGATPPTPPPPPPPGSPSLYCPRGVILTPAYGSATASSTVTVTGMVSNKWAFGNTTVPSAFLIVNGAPTPVTLNGLEFTTTTTLGAGDNTLEVAFPAGVLKPIGCAPQTALDTDPISISGAHRVFHDPDQADVDAYRRAAGWDIATRAIVRTGGVPLAGLDFMVPGTDIVASTDGDGVVQIDLDSTKMAGATVTADQISTGVFNDVGIAVANIRADQQAQSIAALQGLITLAISAADAPPAAASSVEKIVDQLAAIQVVATKLLQSLQAQQIPNAADVAALEQLGLQFASTRSNGEIVITARDYPNLTITVKVK